MANLSRAHGLLLMAVGMLVFSGTINDVLPAVAFWPALLLCLVGCVVFMKANRIAMEDAEERTRRALNPVLRNQNVDRYTATQEKADGQKIATLGEAEGHPVARSATTETQLKTDELTLYEVDGQGATSDDGAEQEEAQEGQFVVTTDVSFPLEVQQQDSLAEQLQKLNKLREGGILSDDEFAIAKAKLLS